MAVLAAINTFQNHASVIDIKRRTFKSIFGFKNKWKWSLQNYLKPERSKILPLLWHCNKNHKTWFRFI